MVLYKFCIIIIIIIANKHKQSTLTISNVLQNESTFDTF